MTEVWIAGHGAVSEGHDIFPPRGARVVMYASKGEVLWPHQAAQVLSGSADAPHPIESVGENRMPNVMLSPFRNYEREFLVQYTGGRNLVFVDDLTALCFNFDSSCRHDEPNCMGGLLQLHKADVVHLISCAEQITSVRSGDDAEAPHEMGDAMALVEKVLDASGWDSNLKFADPLNDRAWDHVGTLSEDRQRLLMQFPQFCAWFYVRSARRELSLHGGDEERVKSWILGDLREWEEWFRQDEELRRFYD